MFIAEIGINHNGEIAMVKEMILMAKRAGADVVKFQKRNVQENIPANCVGTTRKVINGEVSYETYKYGLELDLLDYCTIDHLCTKIGIAWTASVWDLPSVDFIDRFDVPFIKIPSARLNETKLLQAVNYTDKPVILSVGMSSEDEVDAAMSILDNVQAIMYCKSIYPPQDEDLNLNTIGYLAKKYGCDVGYSSHDTSIYPLLCASAAGAKHFEAHVTLSKKLFGSDQACSFEEPELTELVTLLKRSKAWMGTPRIECLEAELAAKDKLRREI